MTERKGEIHRKLTEGLRDRWNAAKGNLPQAKVEEARRAEGSASVLVGAKDEDANSDYLSKGSNVSSQIAIRHSAKGKSPGKLAGKPAPIPLPRVDRLCRHKNPRIFSMVSDNLSKLV